jgi:hypothetical protein
MFIPSSGSCFYKCLKYFYGEKIIRKNKCIYDEGTSLEKYIPNVFIITKEKNENPKFTKIYGNDNSNKKIVLIYICRSLYHSVILKKKKKKFSCYTLNDFNIDFLITDTPKIETDVYKLKIETPKVCSDEVVSFDIETFVVDDANKKSNIIESKILVPFSLYYNIVNLKTGKITKGNIFEKTENSVYNMSEIYGYFIKDLHKHYIGTDKKNFFNTNILTLWRKV